MDLLGDKIIDKEQNLRWLTLEYIYKFLSITQFLNYFCEFNFTYYQLFNMFVPNCFIKVL